MTAHVNTSPELRSLYFSRVFKKPVRIQGRRRRHGRASDIVFALQEPLPKAVGLFLDHGWGKPTEFIPWDRVTAMDATGVMVLPPDEGDRYPAFQDQPGWILADKHLMGRTILDIDDRDIEVVNDVLMQESADGWQLAAVDASFNGWFRKWGLESLTSLIKDDLIAWKWVQPLSVEDAAATDRLQLSVTKEQLHDLPKEDLADALEELSGPEQEALFSALEPGKAAEILSEAEPRAQRQIISHLREERARNILASLSTPQLVDLLTVLPHEDARELVDLLPDPRRERVQALLSEREVTALDFMSRTFLTVTPLATVREAQALVRSSGFEFHDISYLYVVDPQDQALLGVVDARQLLVEPESAVLEQVMTSPAVAADADAIREDLTTLFQKYHYRMLPVVDAEDRIQGVIRYNDVMTSAGARA
jgi:CBS domain-containing protein